MIKPYLVAQREFLDNVRTKTFWFGILVIPIIWVAAFFIGRFFEDVKDVRPYAIIDESGWLDAAVTEKFTYEDFTSLVSRARKLAEDNPEKLAGMPPEFKRLGERMRDARSEGVLGPLFDWLLVSSEVKRLVAVRMSLFDFGGNDLYVPPEVVEDEFFEERERLVSWWLGLSSAEARRIDAGTRNENYRRLTVPESEDPEAFLREKLQAGPKELFAYFVFGPDPVSGSKGFKYVSNNTIDNDLLNDVSRISNSLVRLRRFEKEEISKRAASNLLAQLRFSKLQVGDEGVEEEVSGQDVTRQYAPVAFTYLLWLTVFITVQMLLTNTIEEKSNRIIEVLLSSVSPLQLMLGKVLGIAATGLTMIISWIIFSILALKYLPKLFGGQDMPDLMIVFQEPIFLVSFVGYFICGYLLYAAILVGLGSVCNSLKEAQNLMNPVMILLIIPLIAMMPVSKDPNGTLAKALSFIPFFTPFTMMNRSAGPPELWEYAATTVLLLISIAVAFWGAAKVFRIGILMTGKPPKPTEILRWLRAPVGAVPEVREGE